MAQILANHFQTVYTRERSLPDVGLPSHTENAKFEYVQILCNDVKKKEDLRYHLSNIPRPHWILDDYQKIGWQPTYR